MQYLKIPIEYCQLALSRGLVRPAQVHLAGLHLFPGKVQLADRPYQLIREQIKVSERTVSRAINTLIGRNWVGIDHKNKWLFIRGLNKVHEIENFSYKRSALMFAKDLGSPKAFFVGAVVSSLCAGTGRNRSIAARSEHPGLPRYYYDTLKENEWPVSVDSIAKILNISRSQASNLRKMANEAGYIKKRPILIERSEYNYSNATLLRLTHPELGRKLVFSDGKVHQQFPDAVLPKIHLKSRRNISIPHTPCGYYGSQNVHT